jgi:hypothetical protein
VELLVDWKIPARWALFWAVLGVAIVIVGLMLDRFTDTYLWVIWLLLGIGITSIVAGAIILLNAVAPPRHSVRIAKTKKVKSD